MKLLKKYWNKKAISLTELIIAIWVLVILSTVWYISYNWYSQKARDTKRISDIKDVESALNLFYIHNYNYPSPDQAWSVTFSWELAWNQWKIWDNFITNLSNDLTKKPLDPLYDIEYIYSVSNKKQEYQIMTVHETDEVSYDKITNKTLAKNEKIVKINWNFNWLFLNTKNYFVPIPSIITSETLPCELTNSWALDSLVVENNENIPYLWVWEIAIQTWSLDIGFNYYDDVNIKSPDSEKIHAVELIQSTFSWSSLDNQKLYSYINKADNDYDKLQIANRIFWWEFSKLKIKIEQDIISAPNPVDIILSWQNWKYYICEMCD